LTKEHERRVIAALAETQRTLDRAMFYSPQFRDHKLIAECHAHLLKLNAMLALPQGDPK